MDYQKIIDRIKKVCCYEENLNIIPYEADCLKVDYDGKVIKIGYGTITDFCRAVSLSILNLRKGKKQFSVKQKARFTTNGTMLDMSRGCVMKPDALKKFIDHTAAMGQNMIMLYTEDTYEVQEYPYMGYMRGKYTAEEFRSIDEYAHSMGVELIGCIQTLGHLEKVLKYGEFSNISDEGTVLLVDEDKTYDFLDACIKSIAANIRSKRIHIGFDETFGLGKGKYKELYGECNPRDLMIRHLRRVCDICAKYGLKPMVWSDCFFRYVDVKDHGWGVNYPTECIFSESIKRDLPPVDMVYWEYEERNQEVYEAVFEAHKNYKGKTIYCGTCWSNGGHVPAQHLALAHQFPALRAALKCGCDEAFVSYWYSDLARGDYFLNMTSNALYAQFSYLGEETTYEDVRELLLNCTGIDADVIAAADCWHDTKQAVDFAWGERYFDCPLLVNTIGVTDNDFEEKFFEAAKVFRDAASNEWRELYDISALVLEIGSIKAGIIKRIQNRYKLKDMEYFKNLSEKILPNLLDKLYELHSRRMKRWYEVNKPFGLHRVNKAYGNAIADAIYSKQRIDAYVSGEISGLEELNEEVVSLSRPRYIENYTEI